MFFNLEISMISVHELLKRVYVILSVYDTFQKFLGCVCNSVSCFSE